MRIVRAGRRLGMILHGEGGAILTANARDGFVVEVDVRHLHVGLVRSFVGVDGETVVLRRDFAQARKKVLDGMVQTPVTVVHFVSRNAARLGQ